MSLSTPAERAQFLASEIFNELGRPRLQPQKYSADEVRGLILMLKEAADEAGLPTLDVIRMVAYTLCAKQPEKAERLRKLFLSLQDEPVSPVH